MKVKKLCAMIVAFAVACSQAVIPAFAETDTPNGDWTDVSGLTPVYTAESTTLGAGGTITTEEAYGDFIIEFEATLAADDRFQFRKDADGTTKPLAYVQQSWVSANQANSKHIQYLLSVNGANKNGWFAGYANADSDFPSYTVGQNIRFRLQTKGTTMSYWAADLGTDVSPVANPVYKYGGYHTQNEVRMLYPVQLYTKNAATINNLKVYSLGGTAELAAKSANAAVLTLSDAPSSELAADAVTLTDSYGNKITSSAAEKVSDKVYNITFAGGIVSGVSYEVAVAATNSLGGEYAANDIKYLAPSADVDFDDDSWKDEFTLRTSGNLETGSNAQAQVTGGVANVMNSDKLISLKDYASNLILEFDGTIPTTNTSENKAYMQIETSSSNYTNGVAYDMNRLWIYASTDSSTAAKVQRLTYTNNSANNSSGNSTHHGIAAVSGGVIINKGDNNSYRYVINEDEVSLYIKAENGEYTLIATEVPTTAYPVKTNSGRIQLGANYAGSAVAAVYDNIKIYELNSSAKATVNANTVTVEYSIEPTGTLTANDFIVTDENGNTVTDFTVERTGVKTYTFTFGTLDEGTEYTIATASENIYSGSTAAASFTAVGYDVAAETDSTIVTITNPEAAANAAVIFAVYSDDGLEDVAVKTMSEKDENNAFTFSGVADGQSYKVLIWDSVTGMNPLVK
ncbi:MAG: hypothetical protein J6C82_07830 [Clostridia bacterium]|nr:hypothetical protein [Clostridia bacterium]